MEKYWSEYSQVKDKIYNWILFIFLNTSKNYISLQIYVDNCTGKKRSGLLHLKLLTILNMVKRTNIKNDRKLNIFVLAVIF